MFSCGASIKSSLPRDTKQYYVNITNNTIKDNTNRNTMLSSKKKVPKSLSECYQIDNVSGELYNWSDRLKVWGCAILWILIILGVISTIANAIQIADVEEELVFITVITSVITWGFYTLIEYCTYNVLSLLTWICNNCGQMRTQSPCPQCGNE